MFVTKADFFALLGNVVKISKNVALRVLALHVGGLLLRHAPVISMAISMSSFVTQAVDDVRQQQVTGHSHVQSHDAIHTRHHPSSL